MSSMCVVKGCEGRAGQRVAACASTSVNSAFFVRHQIELARTGVNVINYSELEIIKYQRNGHWFTSALNQQ